MKRVKFFIELGIIIVLSVIILYKISADAAKESRNLQENTSYSVTLRQWVFMVPLSK